MRIGDKNTGPEKINTAAWAAAAMVLSIGLTLTAGAVLWQQQSSDKEARLLLDHQTELLQDDIAERFTLPIYGLKGARGMMAAMRGPVGRAPFAAYVASRDLPGEFPGARGFGVIQSVLRHDLPAFIKAQREDGEPDFDVHGKGGAEQLFVVTQVEPKSRNAPAWGLDVGGDPVRRQAIERAIASGEATLSAPVTLAQDENAGAGFLMLVPVFRDAPGSSLAGKRPKALQGLLFAPLIAQELLKGGADAAAVLLDIDLAVRNADGGLTPLLAARGGELIDVAKAAGRTFTNGPVLTSRHFDVAGREFVLETTLSPATARRLLQLSGLWVVTGGALLSLLAAFTVFLLSAGRARAEALAQGMTADLQRLAMVASRTTNAVVITDAQHRITWVNEGFTRITGYGADEVLGQKPGDLLQFEGSDPQTVQTMRAALAARRGCHVELLNRGKNGRQYWLDIEIQPLQDDAGALTGFMAIESDISERKHAEQALAHERNRYAGILGAQTELICRFEPDGRLTFVNEAFCRFFGVQAEAVVGHTWAPMVHPDDLDRVQREVAALRPDHSTVVIENRVHLANGDMRWGQFVNRGFFDARGQLIETQSVGRDITERKELEAQIHEARASLQDLYDNAPCAYCALDAEGRFISVNTLGLSWTGCSAEDLIGRLGLADFFDAEGRASFAANFPRFKRDGRVSGLEFELIGRHGRTRRVSLSATAVYDADGRFVRSRSVMFDITETHRIRQQLHQLNIDQRAMLESDLVGIVKVKGRQALWHNGALERMFGYDEGELRGHHARMLYPDDESFQALGARAYPQLKAGRRFRTQQQMRRKDGTLIWVDMAGIELPAASGDRSGESLWMMLDITQSKAYEARMEHAALHDALTGLPNRMLLADRLRQAIHAADRSGHVFALAYLDLNGFKQINDTHGHDAGDEVLKAVAARLQAGLRAGDTVARLGGDEFVVLLTPMHAAAEAEPALNRLLDALDRKSVV